MTSIKPHAFAAASLVLALQLLAAVPCAQARPAAAHAPSASTQAAAHPWLRGALSWLGRLLAGSPGGPGLPTQASAVVGPLTGSCIDPQGIKPCGQ